MTLNQNLDGSCCDGMPITSVKEFLREMAVLAGQDEGKESPELELQVGEVVSRTTIEMINGIEYMIVAASLPASEQSSHFLARAEQTLSGNAFASGATISWNPACGCYVAIRRTQTRKLQDDRSVMDTILSTIDEAIGWQDLLKKLHFR